ncbi:hypothetical protein GCM10027089_55250 [Nocardia thraciensis]
MTSPDEEVIRILAHADPSSPSLDAYVIVTLTRPHGSTEPVWRPFATYGPMTFDVAEDFLNRLATATSRFRHEPT